MHTSGSQADTIPVLLLPWMSCITGWSPSWAELALLTSISHRELAVVLVSISWSKELALLKEPSREMSVCSAPCSCCDKALRLKLSWQLCLQTPNPPIQPGSCLNCLPVPHAMDTCVLPAWVTAEYHRLSFPTSEHSVLNFLQWGNKKVSEREAWVQTVCCSKVCVVALLCLGARYLSL